MKNLMQPTLENTAGEDYLVFTLPDKPKFYYAKAVYLKVFPEDNQVKLFTHCCLDSDKKPVQQEDFVVPISEFNCIFSCQKPAVFSAEFLARNEHDLCQRATSDASFIIREEITSGSLENLIRFQLELAQVDPCKGLLTYIKANDEAGKHLALDFTFFNLGVTTKSS